MEKLIFIKLKNVYIYRKKLNNIIIILYFSKMSNQKTKE